MATADHEWTTEDLEAIKCAIMQVSKGERMLVHQLTEFTKQYQATPLKELQALYKEIEATIAVPGATQGTRRPLVYRSRYAKGL